MKSKYLQGRAMEDRFKTKQKTPNHCSIIWKVFVDVASRVGKWLS
jgi:hypothetical protein